MKNHDCPSARRADGPRWRAARPGILACWVLLGLTGCASSGSTGTWLQFDPMGNGVAASRSDKVELKLMQAETSPIPGAQARVFPPPADAPQLAGAAPANFCVTVAGYCPLAASVLTGENCLCAAPDGEYGGKTGAAPQTMTMRRMTEGPASNAPTP